MFQDSVNKKMFAIDREGQYLFDFGHCRKEYMSEFDKSKKVLLMRREWVLIMLSILQIV